MLVTGHPVFRRFWYPVMPMEQLADGPKPFRLLATDIVLWLDADGKPAAALDRCCHRTAKLSRGFCEAGRIVCGYHGWQYDRTGRCVRVPQIDPAREVKFGIPAYHCEERYGYAWVALAEPLYDIPEIPEAADSRFRRIPQFYETWDCAAMRFMENAFDAAHIAFVHRKTFGNQADPSIAEARIEPFEDGFHFFSESQVRNPDIQKKNLGIASEMTTRRRRNTYWLPFNMRLGIHYPNGLTHTIVNIMTPVEDNRSVLVQFCYRNDTEEQAKAADVIAFDRAVTLEDKYILETTEADVRLTDYAAREMSMPSDRPGLLIRRMLHDLLARHGEAASVAADAPDAVTVE